jgi:hypothetical protein
MALMQPTPPSFLDVRSHDQLEAEVIAADASIQQHGNHLVPDMKRRALRAHG